MNHVGSPHVYKTMRSATSTILKVLACACLLSACADATEAGDEPAVGGDDQRVLVTADPNASSDAGATSEAVAALLMTDTSIGPVRLGMTEGDLLDALEPGWTIGPDEITFEEGFDVRPVEANGQTLFFVRFSPDNDQVDTIVTTSSVVTTDQGLSPGMSVDDAEALLGSATLTFYRFEGGRESVEFPTEVPQLVRPRAGDGMAGIYDFEIEPEDPIGPFVTTEHLAEARIFSLTIELG